MSITIQLPTELEKRLKEIAAERGEEVEDLIADLLKEKLLPIPNRMQRKEAELLLKINLGISEEEWNHFYQLLEKRDMEIMTPQEHRELIDLTEKIEKANTRRMQYLTELALLKNISLDQLMNDLGIEPISSGDI